MQKGPVVFRMVTLAWLALVSMTMSSAAVQAQESSARDEEIPGVIYFEIESAAHSTEPVEYEMSPPAGGEHHPVWQDCGFYDELIVPEHAVHSQEHGAVWITYDPGLDDEQLGQLEQFAVENQYVLVSPFL